MNYFKHIQIFPAKRDRMGYLDITKKHDHGEKNYSIMAGKLDPEPHWYPYITIYDWPPIGDAHEHMARHIFVKVKPTDEGNIVQVDSRYPASEDDIKDHLDVVKIGLEIFEALQGLPTSKRTIYRERTHDFMERREKMRNLVGVPGVTGEEKPVPHWKYL